MDYKDLNASLSALTEGVPALLTNLANAAALLWETLPDLNWAGFYLLRGDALLLGPFQGRPACTRIPVGKGVCGAAVRENKAQRVADVHTFPGHIACDERSRSELVIPLQYQGRTVGVLDLDSPLPDRFTPEDEAGLSAFAEILETRWGPLLPEA